MKIVSNVTWVNKVNKKDCRIEELERQIKIKDAWCQMIWMIGCDYDGCNKVESLKKLVDELVDYSNKARVCDDKSVVYTESSTGIKKNILLEEIE